jgi:hypothetical protein
MGGWVLEVHSHNKAVALSRFAVLANSRSRSHGSSARQQQHCDAGLRWRGNSK